MRGTLEVPTMEWRLDEARFSGTMEVDATGQVPTANVDLKHHRPAAQPFCARKS